MTEERNPQRSLRRETMLPAAQLGLRGTATAAALVAAYYLAPVRAKTPMEELLWLGAALAAFAAIIALHVRAIARSRHPRWRAIESMAVAIPLFLIMFARIYLTMSTLAAHAFSVDLDRTRALYFTITVFSTVGFGDISPQTNYARLFVSGQMLLDLVVLGVVVRVLFGAAQRSVVGRDGGGGDRGRAAD